MSSLSAAITGTGVITAVAKNTEEFLTALQTGKPIFSKLTGFPIPRKKDQACLIRPKTSALHLATQVSQEALSTSENASQNTGIILATLYGESNQFLQEYPFNNQVKIKKNVEKYTHDYLLNGLAEKFQINGPRFIFSNACATSNIAIGTALDMIRLNQCDRVLIVSVELIKPSMQRGAERLGLLGRELKPFDKHRNGTLLGEGAAAVILEKPGKNNHAKTLAWLSGYACQSDRAVSGLMLINNHSSLLKTMQLALEDAHLSKNTIDYINAYASGTPLADKFEALAIDQLFKSNKKKPLINSTKSLVGHTSSVSGLIELIACALQMKHGFIHTNHGLTEVDPELPTQQGIVKNKAKKNIKHCLSNAIAADGINATIVISQHAEPQSFVPQNNAMYIVNNTSLGPSNLSSLNAEKLIFDIESLYPKKPEFKKLNRCSQLALAIAHQTFSQYKGNLDHAAIVCSSQYIGHPEADQLICEKLASNPNTLTPYLLMNHSTYSSPSLINQYYKIEGYSAFMTGSSGSSIQALRLCQNLLLSGRSKTAVTFAFDSYNATQEKLAQKLRLTKHSLGESAQSMILTNEPSSAALVKITPIKIARLTSTDSLNKLLKPFQEHHWKRLYWINQSKQNNTKALSIIKKALTNTVEIIVIPNNAPCHLAPLSFIAVSDSLEIKEDSLIIHQDTGNYFSIFGLEYHFKT